MFYITRKLDDINESSVCNIDIGGVQGITKKIKSKCLTEILLYEYESYRKKA